MLVPGRVGLPKNLWDGRDSPGVLAVAVLAPSEKFATQHHRCQPRSGGKLLMHRPRLCDCGSPT